MKKLPFKKIKWRKVTINEIDDRLLLINLYVTQLGIFLISCIILLFQRPNLADLFHFASVGDILLWGSVFTAAAIAFDFIVTRFFSEDLLDDGGVNQRLFAKRPVWHLIIICLVVAFCEELLFRGVIMNALDNYWTSVLFAAIHVRYWRHWIMTGLVFCISYGLGWIYLHTGSIWTPIFAHFLIDLIMSCIIRFNKEDIS